MKYVGTTSDPEAVKQKHGNPEDWWQRNFEKESESHHWLKAMLDMPGHIDGAEEGWEFGYTYTITKNTAE
jgi:hypothetical protein